MRTYPGRQTAAALLIEVVSRHDERSVVLAQCPRVAPRVVEVCAVSRRSERRCPVPKGPAQNEKLCVLTVFPNSCHSQWYNQGAVLGRSSEDYHRLLRIRWGFSSGAAIYQL